MTTDFRPNAVLSSLRKESKEEHSGDLRLYEYMITVCRLWFARLSCLAGFLNIKHPASANRDTLVDDASPWYCPIVLFPYP